MNLVKNIEKDGKAIGVDFLENMVARGTALAKKYKRENFFMQKFV